MKDIRDKTGSFRLAVSLDDFLTGQEEGEGLHIADLPPLQGIRLQTRNHFYSLWVLDPKVGQVLICGGQYFPEYREAYLCGSSWQGCFLKVGWIGVGMCMEMIADGRRIVSSPLQSFTVDALCPSSISH